MNAWEKVSLDPVIGNGQTGRNYWQRIEDLFHRFMPQPSNRTLRSLQGRYDVIKKCCSRWSGCLEQVRNAPPSGCTIDDYDRIAQERYKQMDASKGKPFGLQHCWKLLKDSEKWRLRDEEAPPSKKARSSSPSVDDSGDDDDDDDDGEGRRSPTPKQSKGRADGRKRSKVYVAEAASMREKIDELMKAGKEMAAEALQSRKELAEKKQEEKMARWQQVKENEEKKLAEEKRKSDFEERRLLLEENRMRQEIIAEEQRFMMMDPKEMDKKARKYWEIRRAEILQSRMSRAGMMGGEAPSSFGSGNDGDGNNGVA